MHCNHTAQQIAMEYSARRRERTARGWGQEIPLLTPAPHFFFHWHYSPLWALACRTMSFQFFSYLPPTLSIFSLPALEDLFLLPFSILPWVFPFSSSLPVLQWRSFRAPYPPPFSLGDLTSLFCALLSILLYFLLCLSLLVLDSSSFNEETIHKKKLLLTA